MAKKRTDEAKEGMGELLKRLREERGFTQKTLAQAAKVSVDAVRNYEQNRREPTISAVKLIADALHVSYTILTDAVPITPPSARRKRDK